MTPSSISALTLAAPSLNSGPPRIDKAKIADGRAMDVAREFEAGFLSTYLETMFSGIKTDGAFGGGTGEGIFRSLLLNEYAADMSKSGGIGIADQVYREILKMQEI
jgi:Rod binding domain-containing protein